MGIFFFPSLPDLHDIEDKEDRDAMSRSLLGACFLVYDVLVYFFSSLLMYL